MTFVRCAQFCETLSAQTFLDSAREQGQLVWASFDPPSTDFLELLDKTLAKLIELYSWTELISDPKLSFDPAIIGQKVPFDPNAYEGLDGKIAPGKPCVIMFPALVCADGTVLLKAKAAEA